MRGLKRLIGIATLAGALSFGAYKALEPLWETKDSQPEFTLDLDNLIIRPSGLAGELLDYIDDHADTEEPLEMQTQEQLEVMATPVREEYRRHTLLKPECFASEETCDLSLDEIVSYRHRVPQLADASVEEIREKIDLAQAHEWLAPPIATFQGRGTWETKLDARKYFQFGRFRSKKKGWAYSKSHDALDIGARPGTPVFALGSGTIVGIAYNEPANADDKKDYRNHGAGFIVQIKLDKKLPVIMYERKFTNLRKGNISREKGFYALSPDYEFTFDNFKKHFWPEKKPRIMVQEWAYPTVEAEVLVQYLHLGKAPAMWILKKADGSKYVNKGFYPEADLSRYGIFVRKGQRVAKGEPIGCTGVTPYSAQNAEHLHMDMYAILEHNEPARYDDGSDRVVLDPSTGEVILVDTKTKDRISAMEYIRPNEEVDAQLKEVEPYLLPDAKAAWERCAPIRWHYRKMERRGKAWDTFVHKEDHSRDRKLKDLYSEE